MTDTGPSPAGPELATGVLVRDVTYASVVETGETWTLRAGERVTVVGYIIGCGEDGAVWEHSVVRDAAGRRWTVPSASLRRD